MENSEEKMYADIEAETVNEPHHRVESCRMFATCVMVKLELPVSLFFPFSYICQSCITQKDFQHQNPPLEYCYREMEL